MRFVGETHGTHERVARHEALFRNDRSGCHGVTQNRFQRIPVVNVPLNIRFDVRGARWRP